MAWRGTHNRANIPSLEWVEEASGVTPRLLLSGGRRAMIENLTGIVEFNEDRIRLNTKSGVMTITGRNMELTQLGADAVTLAGDIRLVELPHKNDA